MVAGIVLAAVWAADRDRPVLAGALLGLACATKQLAWPYAPFLVAQLMGARSLRATSCAREPWMRAARPLLAAAAVFAAIVLPVLLLDPAAMYGDIVAYNVGLAGGDAYPLGGTPGFGAANFAIYFGAVAIAEGPRLVPAVLRAARPARPAAAAPPDARRARRDASSSPAASRWSRRCTSRASCTRTTWCSRRSCCRSGASRSGATRRSRSCRCRCSRSRSSTRSTSCCARRGSRRSRTARRGSWARSGRARAR